MALEIYISGKYFPKEEAKVSVYDHGLLYGDGVFEGIRQYNGRVFRLKEHVDRLYESAKAITLTIPMTPEEMADAIEQTCRKNNLTDGYIRVMVTRGPGNLGLDPRKCPRPEIIIIADTIQLYPEEFYDKGLDLVTVATIRNHPQALNPRIKSLNYLNNILAKIEGQLAGCVEALMLNHKGEVAECSGDNIFLVKHRVLKTPPLDAGILGGITRDAVIEIARGAGFEVHEATLTRHDLYIADELFLTGTAAEVIPVVKLDGRTIGDGQPGPVFEELRSAYRQLVREGR